MKGQWSEWGEVGQCSRSCGGGRQIQTRTCEGRKNEGGNCPGSFSRESECNKTPCVRILNNANEYFVSMNFGW